MREHVTPMGHAPLPPLRAPSTAARSAAPRLEGRESVTFFEIGHLTQVLKGDSLAEDGSCHQQRKGARRESIQPGRR